MENDNQLGKDKAIVMKRGHLPNHSELGRDRKCEDDEVPRSLLDEEGS